MTIAWQRSMETGAPLLDAQHRTLVTRANALLAATEAGADRPVVERALRAFGDYAVRHFSQDEDCALRGRCPALEWNGAARAELIRIVAAFRTAYERSGGTSEVAEGLSADLVTWVSRYIPGPEAARRPCVEEATQS